MEEVESKKVDLRRMAFEVYKWLVTSGKKEFKSKNMSVKFKLGQGRPSHILKILLYAELIEPQGRKRRYRVIHYPIDEVWEKVMEGYAKYVEERRRYAKRRYEK